MKKASLLILGVITSFLGCCVDFDKLEKEISKLGSLGTSSTSQIDTDFINKSPLYLNIKSLNDIAFICGGIYDTYKTKLREKPFYQSDIYNELLEYKSRFKSSLSNNVLHQLSQYLDKYNNDIFNLTGGIRLNVKLTNTWPINKFNSGKMFVQDEYVYSERFPYFLKSTYFSYYAVSSKKPKISTKNNYEISIVVGTCSIKVL